MKGLFCYDGPISRDEHGTYYGTVLNNNVFKRYFSIVSFLDIAIRVEREDAKNIKSSELMLDNIKITEMPNLSSVKGITRRTEAIKKLTPLVKKTDVLFIRLPSFIGNIAIDIAKKYKKPYLVEMVGCPWDSLWNHSIKGKIMAPYMMMVTKKKVKNADRVIYVTNSFLQSRYPTKGKSVSCSNVELPFTEDLVLTNRLKNVLKLEKKMIIGTAAAVNVRYKGQQYIIEAISKLKEEGIYCEYQLVGWGDQSYLKGKAKEFEVEEQVKFLGNLSHKAVFEWLDDIQIYAQPSQQEGLPRALIEAMSRGCPSIGARTGGIPELIEEEYIFNNSKDRIIEICNIIKSFNKINMTSQAKRNFKQSKIYNRDLIQKRREILFQDLKKSVN